VVRLGGDADTNGAVVGALLGARFGAGSFPRCWLKTLDGKAGLLALL
jgi:ADP-ribosyl-[dinitrogen reductase] hydrolase